MITIFAAKTPYTIEPAIEWTRTRVFGCWKPRMNTQWNKTGSVQRNASRPDQRWIRLTTGNGSRITRWRRPHMRVAVDTCTNTRATAAVANQVFIAIVDENTVVTTSVYVLFTSSRTCTTPPPRARVASVGAAPADGPGVTRATG